MKAYDLKIKYQDGKSKIFQQNFKTFQGVPPIFKNQKRGSKLQRNYSQHNRTMQNLQFLAKA